MLCSACCVRFTAAQICSSADTSAGLNLGAYHRSMHQSAEPGRKVRVRLEHRVEYADPLQVAAGEKLSVGREDDEFPGWKWCKAADGREGWVPIELLSNGATEAVVLQDYSARELAVKPGEEVVVEDARHDWL